MIESDGFKGEIRKKNEKKNDRMPMLTRFVLMP